MKHFEVFLSNIAGYGEKLKKQTEIKVKKKLDKIKLIEDNSPSSEQDNDTENLKYFMTVLGLPQYFEVLAANKVTNLAKLRRKFTNLSRNR